MVTQSARTRQSNWFFAGVFATLMLVLTLPTSRNDDGVDDSVGASDDCMDVWREAHSESRGSVQEFCASYP